MQINNAPQRSKEWFEVRALRLTASHAQAIAANGKGLVTYVEKKMSEYYSSAERENYTNKDMERGIELEPQAIMAYSFTKNIEVDSVGFVIYSDFVGCSPDGIAGEDGLVEVKCPSDSVYFKLLQDEKIDSKYEKQMQMQMLICNKRWTDYVVYNPNYEKYLFVKRVFPDPEVFEKLKKGFKAGEEMIKKIMDKMEG